jgi:hypothetical protein
LQSTAMTGGGVAAGGDSGDEEDEVPGVTAR